MNELSREARAALEHGLSLDGPSAERRARVKARLVAALGGGVAALGGSAAAAELASPLVGGAVAGAGAGKGLAAGSLLVWFGVGAAAGVGVSGVVAVTGRHVVAGGAETAVLPRPSPTERAVASRRAALRQPDGPAPIAAPAPAAATASGATEAAFAGRGRLTENAPSGVDGPASAASSVSSTAASVTSVPPLASSSTLSEEAALLQRAERALSGNEPNAALAALAEHERRFPAGALREERRAAKVLALCTLGRVAEARALARAFVNAAPGSVLVPRLERSCAGSVVKAR